MTDMASRVHLKVLVCGGGIAGNALSFWLTKLGHNVTVLEKYPGLRATGLQLDLRGAGIEVMKRMGLEQAFRAKRTPEEGMQMVDSTGKQRAWFPAIKPKAGEKQGFTTEYEMMRGDICRILHDAAVSRSTRAGVKTSAEYVFGTAIKSFQQNDLAVDVHFEDGTSGSYDLLVGADGQWSRTRRMMLASGPDSVTAGGSDGFHPVPGLYFACFTMQRPIQEGEGYIATSYLATKRRGILTRRHSPTEIQVTLSCREDSEWMRNVSRGDVNAEKKAMANIFEGAGWQSDEIVEAMRKSPDFYGERLGFVKLAPWWVHTYSPAKLDVMLGGVSVRRRARTASWLRSIHMKQNSDPLWMKCQKGFWKTPQKSGRWRRLLHKSPL
ncbi:hypothetical protein N0V93_003714 [Gnomoniopsis smithogilvyi]|uniref:Rhodanese domain-containing protein n=1 Tax=Gnomoniopsis smithogilvyi TaxID=1191159 RepID=A0A9W9CZE3_9PEZI|nr:hypothetical protein N0V93_003714 [Gnomoniopsis smithogilvyi]